jgi:thioredoxin reductase
MDERPDGCLAGLERAGERMTVEAGCVLVAAGRVPRLPTLPGGTDSVGLMVAGDADGRRERYVTSAMGDGCRAARLLADSARRKPGDGS